MPTGMLWEVSMHIGMRIWIYLTMILNFPNSTLIRCFADDRSKINQSVLINDVSIGKNCKINRAIIDCDVEIADGFTLENKKEEYKKLINPKDNRGSTLFPEGIIVIPKGMRLVF